MKNNTLDQFKSGFEDEDNAIGHGYTPTKPSLAEIIKNLKGIDVTSTEVIYKDQDFHIHYPGSTLEVKLNHIPPGNVLTEYCNLDIQTGTGDHQFIFSDQCTNFDLSQGGNIRYNILQGNTLLDKGTVLIPDHQ